MGSPPRESASYPACTAPGCCWRSASSTGKAVFTAQAGQRTRRPPAARLALLLAHVPRPDPRLSDAYHLIAPDYPAFGLSAVPDRSAFGYTLDHLAEVVDGLLDHLGIGKFAIYVMDIGAAIGFRLALRHPKRLTAIIVQNAPLYPWEPRGWWATLAQHWPTDPPRTARPRVPTWT